MVNGITRCELDAFIDRLSSVKTDSGDEQRILDTSIAWLTRYRRYTGGAATVTTDIAAPTQDQPSNISIPIGAMKSGPFFGMGMKEACAKQLEIAGGPQTAAEIWQGLSAGGFTSAHNSPPAAVHTALMRRTKTHGDVLLIGKGQWDLKSRYSEAQLAQIAQNIGGMPGRDHASHREKVKRGMLNARKNAVKFGPKPIVTEEMAVTMKPLFAAGLSLRAIGKVVGVSHTTVEDWKERVVCWEQGQPWPPKDEQSSDAAPPNNVTPLRAMK